MVKGTAMARRTSDDPMDKVGCKGAKGSASSVEFVRQIVLSDDERGLLRLIFTQALDKLVQVAATALQEPGSCFPDFIHDRIFPHGVSLQV